MPTVFKKFHQIWNMLTELQIEALNLEFFHGELEKPTQEHNAEKLGITVASYQDRLELVYKKLSRLYPEYKRIRRRKPRSPKSEDVQNPPEKRMSTAKKAEIKQWARENMDNYFGSYLNLTQDWVIVEKDSENSEDDNS